MNSNEQKRNLQFVRVSPEQKRQFDEEGYLILREAIDSDTVSTLVEGR